MQSRPKLFFKSSDERKIADAKIPLSKNPVYKAGFISHEGSKRTKSVFVKPLGDKLSRLEALYETAFSTYIRLSTDRFPENRLIRTYNKKTDTYDITGMASIELPGFIPMQSIELPGLIPIRSSDHPAEVAKITNPTSEMLLKNDVGGILTCNLYFKNTDLNCNNYSTEAGFIDGGQCFYPLMATLKEKTIVTELIEYQPHISTEITEERILNLPYADERRHWPTHLPNTILKTFKAKQSFQDLIKKSGPSEYYLSLDKCDIPQYGIVYLSEINGKIAYTVKTHKGEIVKDIPTKIKAPIPWNLQTVTPLKHRILEITTDAEHTLPHFKTQVYLYSLKFLLSFNKEILQKRLALYFQDEPLGLKALSKDIHDSLCKLLTRHKLYDGNDERSFVEHCILTFEEHYTEILTVVVHMREFREFMLKNPGVILELKDWFIKQNNNPDNIACQYAPYDIDYIENEYYKIYRASFVQPICKHLSELESFIEILKPEVIKSYVLVDAPKEKKERDVSAIKMDLTKSLVFISALPSLKIKAEEEEKNKRKQIKSDKVNYRILISLYSTLINLMTEYYKLSNPTREENRTYIHHNKELFEKKIVELSHLNEHEKLQFINIIKEFEKTLDLFAMRDIDDPPELSESFMLITKESLNISKDIDEAIESAMNEPMSVVPRKDEAKESVIIPFLNIALDVRSFSSRPSPDLKPDEIIKLLAQLISERIITLDHEKINAIIHQALTEYTPFNSYLNIRAYSSNRTADIIKLQEQFSSIHLLKEIFHQKKQGYWGYKEPGWEETSFNTILIKNLSLNALKYYNDEKDAIKLIQKNLSHRCSQVEDIRKLITDKRKPFYWASITKVGNIAKDIASQIPWDKLIEEEALMKAAKKSEKSHSPLQPVLQ